jgi:hypothetical protein
VLYVRRLTTFSHPVQVPAAVPGIQTDRSFEYRKRSRGLRCQPQARHSRNCASRGLSSAAIRIM